MKPYVALLCLLVCGLALAGCQEHPSGDPPAADPTISENGTAPLENEVVLQEPPALTVIFGEESIEALRGTSSWMYDNGDGTFTGIEADSAHPLQAKEYMTPLYLMPTPFSHSDLYAATLQWEVPPDRVSARCWAEEAWGQYDAESQEVPVTTLCIDSSNPESDAIYGLELKLENTVYEITAHWERSERFSGTAHYSFYTVIPDMELQ